MPYRHNDTPLGFVAIMWTYFIKDVVTLIARMEICGVPICVIRSICGLVGETLYTL